MYRASCTVCYTDQQIHNIYTHYLIEVYINCVLLTMLVSSYLK